MGKVNDKKVVKEARNVLVSALSNLLQSERERTFRYRTKVRPKPRSTFCKEFNLQKSTVAHIETGRMLGLSFDQLRVYLAALLGRNDREFVKSFRKVYDGLKELDHLLGSI